MSKIISLLLIASVFVSFKNPDPTGVKSYKLKVSYSFDNIVAGYDHHCKTAVYIDGVNAGESSVKSEGKKNSVTVLATAGMHDVRIVNSALYQGT